jgi:hypothetical protein
MKLTIQERFVLTNILPKEGSYTELVITSDLRKKVDPTQKELKEIQYTPINDGTGRGHYNVEKANTIETEIKIEELEENQVKEALKKLDEEKKLTADHITLYKKFII